MGMGGTSWKWDGNGGHTMNCRTVSEFQSRMLPSSDAVANSFRDGSKTTALTALLCDRITVV